MSIVKLAPASQCRTDGMESQAEIEYLFSAEAEKESEVITGSMAGSLLSQYLKDYGKEILGTDANDATLPFTAELITNKAPNKMICDDLDLTTIWVVLFAQSGSKLYFGSAEDLHQADLSEGFKDLLHGVEAARGDIFTLEAGTAYAFDENVQILQIQAQSPNTVYVPADESKSVEMEPVADHVHEGDNMADGQGERAIVATTSAFEVDLYQCDGRLDMSTDHDSCKVLIFLDGSAVVEKDDLILHCSPVNTVFVPADTSTFHITGNCRFVSIHLI